MSRRYRRRGPASVVRARSAFASTLPKPSKDLPKRDQREAADTRTEAQRWLNDPPPDRSALAAKRNGD